MMTRHRARLRTARRRLRTATRGVPVDVAAEVAVAADVKTTLRPRTASSLRQLPPLQHLPSRAPLPLPAMTMHRAPVWRAATVVPPVEPPPVAVEGDRAVVVAADATTVAVVAEAARAVVVAVAVTSANLASHVRRARRGSRCRWTKKSACRMRQTICRSRRTRLLRTT